MKKIIHTEKLDNTGGNELFASKSKDQQIIIEKYNERENIINKLSKDNTIKNTVNTTSTVNEKFEKPKFLPVKKETTIENEKITRSTNHSKTTIEANSSSNAIIQKNKPNIKTYLNDDEEKEYSNTNNSKPTSNTIDIKFDPLNNEIKDVNIDMKLDYQTAKKMYDNNKQYLPSKEQIISGAKATGNFVQSSGIADEVKKKKDPLASLFGKK